MNNKELAKLLLKHPLIIKINESQLWDKSVVSRVIAEELMREEEQEEEVDAVKEMEQKVQIVKDRIETLEKQLKKYRIEKRAHLFYDEEDEAEEYQALIDFANKEKAKAIKQLAKFSEAYDKLVSAAKETETPADDKTVSTAAANDSEKFEKISQIISQEPQNKSEAEKELKAIEKINDDNIKNAADATKEPEQNQDAAPAQKLQQNMEKAAETVANVSLAAAGAALVSGPAAPAALAVSKVADIVSTGIDAAALTAAVLNDDQNAIISNGSSLAAGVAAALIPVGGVAKKASKEAVETFVKKVVEKGTKETIQKTIGAIKKDKNKETKAEKVAKQVENKVVEKVREKLEGKTPEEQKAVVQKAAKEVGMDLNQKISNLIGNFNQNLTNKSVGEKFDFLKKQKEIYNKVNIELFKSTHKKAWSEMEKKGVTDKDLEKAIEANKEKALKKISSIEKFGGPEQTKVDGKNVERNAAIDTVIDDLSDISGNVINTAIDIARAGTDISGTDIEGTVGATFADNWIKNNGLEDLSLFKDEQFKAEFARLLEKPGETQGLESEKIRSGDAADVSSSFIGNDNLDDSQSLQEETDVKDRQPETTTVSPEDSAKVREEVQQVIDALRKSDLLNKPLEDLLSSKLPKEGVTEEEVQSDVENQPEVEQFEYDEAVKQEMTTFFADEGANGLGFMQQILLRDQAAQLLGLIRNLDTIIEGPNAGEEKALTTGNEPEAEKQEEPEVSQPTSEPTSEPQPVQEQAEQLPPLSEEEKSNIKKRMTGMVTLLKELRSTSKSYEKYMTRTSRNPRFDGSTLKKRLDETLPEVQRLIAEMVQDLKRYSTDSTIKESLMLEKDGMSRDEKIAFVKQEYLKMREVWIRMKPAFSDKEEKSGIINQAKEMKAIAANKDFLALFPNVTFVSEGEVISIDQANKVLSETIEQFVFAMRDVLTLVKSDRPERNSLIVAQKRLEAIAKAIQDNFGVPMGIPPELQIQQIEDEIQDEDNQAFSDEDQESRIDRLKQFLFDTKEKIGDWLSQMRERFGESFDEYWKHLKEISGEASGFIKELFSEIAKVPGEAMDFISEALKNLVFFLKKSTQEERVALKELMKKARTKTLDTTREIPEASKRIANNTIKFLKDAGIYMKVANRELLDVSASLYEDFKAILGPKFEKLQANTRATIFALFLMMSKPRDIKVEEPTPISRSEDALEEALKPIIEKMLKEYHG
jgi:hypothetical protein